MYPALWYIDFALAFSVTGSEWKLGKGSEVKYQGLEFNMDALKDLGCEYLFSAGEITDAADMGLQYMGYFESDTSYWGIWLYALTE